MSGRSGAGHTRHAALGPQPMKATVPYQLASKPRPSRTDGKPGMTRKARSHQLSPGMRRTMSLDAIIGPYLQGHWPKEPEGQSCVPRQDKSTQVSSTLKNAFKCGNYKYEFELFLSRQLLEVPDGHRAPVPLQSCSSSNDSGLLSPFSSQNEADPSPLLNSSSPGPNKSCCFQREPPEGCERVRVWEEISAPQKHKTAFISSCPDPNKVNFTPYGGSAFCPVSLPKPLLPSMDVLFRSFGMNQGTGIGQAMSSSNRATPPDPPAATTVMGESSGEGLAL
uniref:Family with sequence similarity 117 member Aa n=1 Tax=Amphilophus citrinellus TaxID=61819 RepID=A0A3Q0RYV8_AMPCI